MEIVVAKDENGYIVGIVTAQTKQQALAYWHGAGLRYFSDLTLAEMEIEKAVEDNPSGVILILKTRKQPMGGMVQKEVPLVNK